MKTDHIDIHRQYLVKVGRGRGSTEKKVSEHLEITRLYLEVAENISGSARFPPPVTTDGKRPSSLASSSSMNNYGYWTHLRAKIATETTLRSKLCCYIGKCHVRLAASKEVSQDLCARSTSPPLPSA